MKPILRVPVCPIPSEPGTLTLAGSAAKYVSRVHRLAPGDRFIAFDPERAVESDAEIVRVLRDAIVIRVEASRPATRVSRRDVTLVQAIGKGDKLDAIVRDATELGARRVVPVIAERSVSRPPAGRVARFRRIAVEAARQCGRGDAPDIEPTAPLATVLDRYTATARTERHPVRVCLDPTAEMAFGESLQTLDTDTPLVILIGPEGGLTNAELEAASAAGFHRVSLGGFVLRTETVCAAVLGAILVLGDPRLATFAASGSLRR